MDIKVSEEWGSETVFCYLVKNVQNSWRKSRFSEQKSAIKFAKKVWQLNIQEKRWCRRFRTKRYMNICIPFSVYYSCDFISAPSSSFPLLLPFSRNRFDVAVTCYRVTWLYLLWLYNLDNSSIQPINYHLMNMLWTEFSVVFVVYGIMAS